MYGSLQKSPKSISKGKEQFSKVSTNGIKSTKMTYPSSIQNSPVNKSKNIMMTPKSTTRLILPHPQLVKTVTVPSSASFMRVPSLNPSHQKHEQIKQELYQKQLNLRQQLIDKGDELAQSNIALKKSFQYYNHETEIEKLVKKLQEIKAEDKSINLLIEQCQIVEANTTPEEYFLFKKKQRFDTFNESLDLLYSEVNEQKAELAKFLATTKSQATQIKRQITNLQQQLRGIKSKSKKVDIHQQQQSFIEIKSTISQQSSDSDLGLQLQQLGGLKQQYKSVLQTVQMMQQNKQILTTQLLNGIQNINENIHSYFESEKTKLFRDIIQMKQDFEDMDPSTILNPSQAQLGYQISPLVNDYQNKLVEISKKVPAELKGLAVSLLQPLPWQFINLQSYFQPISKRSSKHADIRGDRNKQVQRMTQQIRRQSSTIHQLEQSIQGVMSQTMQYKQQQHKLQIAMQNMKSMMQGQLY